MRTILLIEDDAFLKQLYQDILSQAGYTVEVVEEGTKALKRIKEGHWNLVLLDILLPNLDGFAILNKLIEEDKKPTCPIIFMTNLDATDEDKEKLNKADDYWVKSNMSPPEFLEKVKKAIK